MRTGGMKLGTPDYSVRYQGLFDFDALYAAMIDWAKSYGYMWHESTYKHKVPSPKGAEQEWAWELSKEVNDYIMYKMKVKMKIYELKEVEVETESGAKKKITSGRIKMTIKGDTITDWQHRFEGSRLREWMGNIYEKIMFKEISGGWSDTQHYRVLNFQAMVKKFLDLQTKHYTYRGYLKEEL